MTATRRFVAAAMLIGLPALTWYVWLCLRFFNGSFVPSKIWLATHRLTDYLPTLSFAAIAFYAFWLLLQAALYVVLPGRAVVGSVLSDGSRLVYRLNGLRALVCTIALFYGGAFVGLPPSFAYDQFEGLLVSANVAAFLIAAFVHARASRDKSIRPDGLISYVMGTSLNPRIGRFDIKFFCESRPGLLLWVALNASCAVKQYELSGVVTTPMLLVNAFQFLYVADYFVHEEAVLSTWDIKHERFGWMLCWGCLVWVPFMYSIQAHYLVTHPHELAPLATAALVALNMTGYVIFRSANIQKHRFRRDPSRPVWGRPPEYIRTVNGALLLTSGWWGIARHLNYFGDLLMGLAWCLPTGFAHPITYFYFVYFLVLLIHRERRDHRTCLQRYGPDWEAYCRRVPWRIVPGLY
jgi:hypothetical protein